MTESAASKWNLRAALLVGAVLWIAGAMHRSLWIDEFHTLEHARGGNGLTVLGSLSSSNHPPLSFLLVSWSDRLFGDAPLALRWWSVLVGLATVVLTARVARRLPSAAARAAAPWLVVLSSYAFLIFTECRMYGLLALAVLGLTETVMSTLAGRSRGWWAALWIALGLHSHYYFVHFGFVIALATCSLAVLRPANRRGFARLLLPTAVGLLLFVPWGMTGFADQFGHNRDSGGSSGLYLNLNGFLQSIAHLLFQNASLGGDVVTYGVSLPGSFAAALLGLLGLFVWWRPAANDLADRAPAEGAHGARTAGGVPERGLSSTMLGVVGFAAPLWGFAFAATYARAGYNWRYIAGSCVPVLLLVAAGVGWRPLWRAAVSGVLFATMAVVTLVNVASPGQEDFRGCVSYIRDHAVPGDAVLLRPLREVNPEISPTGWEYYVDRVGAPADAPLPVAYRLGHYDEAIVHDRVWFFARYGFPAEVLEALSKDYPRHEVVQVGRVGVMAVHLFAR
jgi:hypothetical protein